MPSRRGKTCRATARTARPGRPRAERTSPGPGINCRRRAGCGLCRTPVTDSNWRLNSFLRQCVTPYPRYLARGLLMNRRVHPARVRHGHGHTLLRNALAARQRYGPDASAHRVGRERVRQPAEPGPRYTRDTRRLARRCCGRPQRIAVTADDGGRRVQSRCAGTTAAGTSHFAGAGTNRRYDVDDTSRRCTGSDTVRRSDGTASADGARYGAVGAIGTVGATGVDVTARRSGDDGAAAATGDHGAADGQHAARRNHESDGCDPPAAERAQSVRAEYSR